MFLLGKLPSDAFDGLNDFVEALDDGLFDRCHRPALVEDDQVVNLVLVVHKEHLVQ